jgi:mannosyl-glycoprotein endo-beta-N-acetylglucosaminidase
MLNVDFEQRPLSEVRELEQWTRLNENSAAFHATRSRVPYRARRRVNAESSARLLVAHDFKGGYREDANLKGSSERNAYTMHDGWRVATEFVYFAHHLVSVPPVGWIECAHRVNALCLGTIITEWDDGRRRLNEMLRSHAAIEHCVAQLVKIAVHFGFDGWLVNIENPVEDVPALKTFLLELTSATHAAIPHGRVIWYDSVIDSGELRWQNCLNRLNSSFFELADGLFTNYHWREDTPRNSASLAGNRRRRDVYFGIDVHGRNTFGGGGFKSDVACRVALAAGTSVALFAPGWTHENFGAHLVQRTSRLFFDAVADHFELNRYELPFWTNFNPGSGAAHAVFVQGRAAGRTSITTQMRLMRPQLSWSFERCIEKTPRLASFFSVQLREDDAFLGSCCLRLGGFLEAQPDHAVVRLFATDFGCDGGLRVTVSLRFGHADDECALLLLLDDGSLVVLAASSDLGNSVVGLLPATAIVVTPLSTERHADRWLRRTFVLPAHAQRRVRQMSAVAVRPHSVGGALYECCIGDIGVARADVALECPPIARFETFDDALVWHHAEPVDDAVVVAYVVHRIDGSAQFVPTNVAFGMRSNRVTHVTPVLSNGELPWRCTV